MKRHDTPILRPGTGKANRSQDHAASEDQHFADREGVTEFANRVSEAVKPKRFAGILGAAPSVAIAGLVVGSLAKGPLEQAPAARTMIAGAVALTVCAAVLVPAVRRWGPGWASMAACAAWIGVTLAVYPMVV